MKLNELRRSRNVSNEHGHDVVALPHVRTIAAHLVGDHLARLALPAAKRDVDIVVVERKPHFGLLGCRRALLRLLLNEVRNRGHAGVEGLVEETVNAKRRRHANGANGRVAGRVARDDCGSDRRCRSVEISRKVEQERRCGRCFSLAGMNRRDDENREAADQEPGRDASRELVGCGESQASDDTRAPRFNDRPCSYSCAGVVSAGSEGCVEIALVVPVPIVSPRATPVTHSNVHPVQCVKAVRGKIAPS